MKYQAMLLFALLSCFSAVYAATKPTPQSNEVPIIYDLFAGTVVEQDQQLYLHTCQLMDIKFKLNFNQPTDQSRLSALKQQYPKFWVYLRAHAAEQNGEYVLKVDGITEEYPKQSCHLLDTLQDLAAE